jgi:hypothetical protein
MEGESNVEELSEEKLWLTVKEDALCSVEPQQFFLIKYKAEEVQSQCSNQKLSMLELLRFCQELNLDTNLVSKVKPN